MNDKPETCPTCGGLCTSKVVSAPDEVGMVTSHCEYEPLVKGEVVAEGWAMRGVKTLTPLTWYWLFVDAGTPESLRGSREWPPLGTPPAVLMVRKEDSMTGGKE